MKILVLGSMGQIGRCLNDQLRKTSYETIYTSRKQIDIANFVSTKSKISKICPQVIINAAAYTSVDKAEEDIKNANKINHLAVNNLAKICFQLNCLLIHISSDYVFDGKSNKPYKENDKTNPRSVYGKTKLNGEIAIKASGCKNIIIRTSWVYSEYGNNFLKTMLRLGMTHDEVSIVSDQIGCPTYAQDIAKTILEIISKQEHFKDNNTYHYSGNEACSWYDFAKIIFDHAKNNNLQIPKKIKSIRSSTHQNLAERPQFSVLDCKKIEKDFNVYTSDVSKGVRQVLRKLKL